MEIIDNFSEVKTYKKLDEIDESFFNSKELQVNEFEEKVKTKFLDENDKIILDNFLKKILNKYLIYYQSIVITKNKNHKRKAKQTNINDDLKSIEGIIEKDQYKVKNAHLSRDVVFLKKEEVNKLNKDKINYNLGDMKLNIHQNFTMEDLLDKENLNSFKSYLDVNEKNKNISIKTLKNQENRIIELEKKYNELQKGIDNEFLKTLKEIKVLYPNITQIEAGAINYSLLMESNIDNKKIFLIKSNNDFSENEKNLIKEWLTVKLESNVEVFFTKN